MKKAFTLAEILIVLVIISILLTLMLGAFNPKSNSLKLMFKKAYSVAERTVSDLINDENFYPYDPSNIGFRNMEKTCLPELTTAECNSCIPDNTLEKKCYDGQYKFRNLFVRKFNIVGTPDYPDHYHSIFETTDGIKWTIIKPARDNDHLIIVDVNGEKGPNKPDMNVPGDFLCLTMQQLEERIRNNIASYNANDRDRFFIIVDFDGRVRILSGTLEEEYLKSHDVSK